MKRRAEGMDVSQNQPKVPRIRPRILPITVPSSALSSSLFSWFRELCFKPSDAMFCESDGVITPSVTCQNTEVAPTKIDVSRKAALMY